jgi:hypothetical protein
MNFWLEAARGRLFCIWGGNFSMKRKWGLEHPREQLWKRWRTVVDGEGNSGMNPFELTGTEGPGQKRRWNCQLTY